MSFTLCSNQPARIAFHLLAFSLSSFQLGLFFANLSSLTYLGRIAFYYWIYKLPHSPGMKFLPNPPPPPPLAVYIMNDAALYGVVQKHGTVINIKWRRAYFYVYTITLDSFVMSLFCQQHQSFIIILSRTAIRFTVLLNYYNNYLYHFIHPDVLHFPWDLSRRSKTLAFWSCLLHKLCYWPFEKLY